MSQPNQPMLQAIAPQPIAADRQAPESRTRGVFVPLILVALGVFGATVLPTLRLFAERQALAQASIEQAAPLANAYKLRQAANALFSKTQALAEQGNPSARAVVNALKQRGVEMDPKAQTPAPPP